MQQERGRDHWLSKQVERRGGEEIWIFNPHLFAGCPACLCRLFLSSRVLKLLGLRKVAQRIFVPNFHAEFFPKSSRSFRAAFRGKRRPEKITKNPRHFSMQNSQANTKKNSTKGFWRAGKVLKLTQSSFK